MNDEWIRVMLVDDQELIRTGFDLVLRAETGMGVVAEARDGESALRELERLNGSCDVVLMDVRMPRMNGIEASAEIARRFPTTRVIVLTTFDNDEYVAAAIRAGASGFLLKDSRPSELVDAIRRVVGGDVVMAPSVTRRLIDHLREPPAGQDGRRPDGARASDTGSPGDSLGVATTESPPAGAGRLTRREFEVLILIGDGKNNAEIGAELFLSESTVKTHVGRVLSKLQLRDRVQAVVYARTHDVKGSRNEHL